ncbi:MAG: hypothetical protein KC431_01495, partial [Myxococcales bacterium]|nr:hypothetical protein [Myxococcales bacterium]
MRRPSPSWPSRLRPLGVWLEVLLVLVLLLLPGRAQAGKRSMIPPGQEQTIRTFVEAGLDAGEGPAPSIGIDRDRIHVDVGEGLRFVIFHPEVALTDPGDSAVLVAPGVLLVCGPAEAPRPCSDDERERERPRAEALARARDEVADTIWIIEESGQPGAAATNTGSAEDTSGRPSHDPPRRSGDWIGQLAALLALVTGLGLALVAARERRRERRTIPPLELAALLALLTTFVALTLHFTALMPLHEHNSFVARSDCAIDERCVDDPVSGWSPTAFAGYRLLLTAIPYEVPWLSRLSLILSLIDLVLAWALARTTMLALGRPRLASIAGLTTVAILALHPVFWRLAGSASFWPWSLAWMQSALLAGLWASRVGRPRLAALGWLVAATSLALAAGGNLVCLTLGPLFLLAPLC